jgi:hypothetical protein
VQLQQTVADLKRRGIGLAAVSYDAPSTLKTFADKHAISFALLSDEGSATIKRYGILNTEARARIAGIPYPGTLVVDARGVVTARSFEERYEERTSGASLLAAVTGGQPASDSHKTDTPHLALAWSKSDAVVAPGTRFSLTVTVSPKPKMHVYAPEQKDYIPIQMTIEAVEGLRIHPPVFPKPERYFFAPLQETQLVFSKPFRIIQDVTLAVTPAVRQRAAAAGATLTIKGSLRYQACDDKVCYMPQTIPLAWTIGLKPLER